MTMTPNDARARVAEIWPMFRAEQQRLNRIDRWWRWDHDKPHQPRQATAEYRQLVDRSQTPWLSLVVNAVVQGLYVEGYRRAKDPENAAPWLYWQANGQDARQVPLHRAAIAYGLAYSTVLPGTNDAGEDMPVMRGVSPRRMIAMYEDPAEDDWPELALRADPAKINGSPGYKLRLYDDTDVNYLVADQDGGSFSWVKAEVHDVGVCPVVRYANMLDLEGRAVGEIEPFISIAARIDQTTFDRLVVQRFASWIVRTIAGMSLSDTTADDGETVQAKKQRLKIEDILVAEDADTKFGSLPASPLDGFIAAKDADIKDLAAVTQTAPHHLLGQMVNLSAEALAAAEANATRKKIERQHSLGESHEQRFRLAASIMGDKEAAAEVDAQVRWRDMESRSLAQAADALGKLASLVGVPVEILWEQIPGWTQQDVERAKQLATEQGGIKDLIDKLSLSGPNPIPVAQ